MGAMAFVKKRHPVYYTKFLWSRIRSTRIETPERASTAGPHGHSIIIGLFQGYVNTLGLPNGQRVQGTAIAYDDGVHFAMISEQVFRYSSELIQIFNAWGTTGSSLPTLNGG